MKPLFAEQGIPAGGDLDTPPIQVDPESSGVRCQVLVAASDTEKSRVCRVRRSLQRPFAEQFTRFWIISHLAFHDVQRVGTSTVAEEPQRQ